MLNFSTKENIVTKLNCNVVTPNSDWRLWWTRHPHVHLAAAAQPLFDPRGIEPRRPEDERDVLNLLGRGGQTIPPLTKYWTLTIFN
ncbi:hypothetical protein TNCV_1575971 [Trichonephila clavipes]|nr:hypothetical protein TNCV_1575971 [Trichonephila clavipes]